MPSGRNLRREAQELIEQAAVQQAESSASRMRSKAPEPPGGTAHQDREASVHTPPARRGKAAVIPGARAPSVHELIGRVPVRERIRDTRGHAGDGDARNVIDGRGYTPRWGGCFDPEHDRGESPEAPGRSVHPVEGRTSCCR